jgi:hypothetical protein
MKTAPKIEASNARTDPPGFQNAPRWLEERIREALAEPAEITSRKQFDKIMAEMQLLPTSYEPSALDISTRLF